MESIHQNSPLSIDQEDASGQFRMVPKSFGDPKTLISQIRRTVDFEMVIDCQQEVDKSKNFSKNPESELCAENRREVLNSGKTVQYSLKHSVYYSS